MTPSQRSDLVKSKGLCFNCLGSGHRLSNCTSRSRCMNCNQPHHTLLHLERRAENQDVRPNQSIGSNQSYATRTIAEEGLSTSAPTFVPQSDLSSRVLTHATHRYEQNQVLLATTRIIAVSPTSGETLIIRALIDPGSQTSFITEAVVQQLGLQKESIHATIQGVGETEIGRSTARVTCKLQACHKTTAINISALVLSKLTSILPNQKIKRRCWPHLKNLQLADPGYFIPANIDLLIGADFYSKIMLGGVRKGSKDSPIAQQTIFGWILSGQVQTSTNLQVNNFHICAELNNNIKKFWEIEELPVSKFFTEEETLCEKHFKENHKRLEDGRYEVNLPLKLNNELVLGRSRAIALARLRALESQFSKTELYKRDYTKCMNEYLELGHMQRVNNNELDFVNTINQHEALSCSYLPHHGVIQESSTTTKLRVVFDASRATQSGVSLNDKMLKGPVIQDDLTTLLLRWRKHKIAFTADVEKMYRQISVTPAHAELQRIVWRESDDKQIEDYKLTTVTFGTKSAPFLATRVLHQLASDEKHNYPLASHKVLSDFYVDDLLSGADTLEIAVETQSQLIQLMTSGGFKLRKWASNIEELLDNIPKEDQESTTPLTINQEENIKTLGIHWSPTSDMFSFSASVKELNIQTWSKRLILSEIAKLFDPLGWLAPIIIIAKIIMQKLWLAGLDWDEEVDSNLQLEWKQFRKRLIEIETIRIPRWLCYNENNQRVEIHGFSDASLRAYAAVVYLCVTDENDIRHTNLIMSKTKVAPIKTISLPRLELSGAALLAKVIKYVSSALQIEITNVYTWTDSEIVLAWLKTHPSKWTSFVANRVSEIHQSLGQNVWRYVPSKENPADCASRGNHPLTLQNDKMWWYGPEWLKQSECHWPKKTIKSTDSEMRKSTLIAHHNTTDSNVIQELQLQFSSLQKLVRVMSYVQRFYHNIKHPTQRISTKYLLATEITKTTELLIKFAQHTHFVEEISLLKQSKPLPSKSRLLPLNIFLDENEIIRIGGRLRFSNLNYNEKFPIVLPEKDTFVSLLIAETHQKNTSWRNTTNAEYDQEEFLDPQCSESNTKSYTQMYPLL